MIKRYDKQTFVVSVNDKEIFFYAYTTKTRCGFCHTVCGFNNDTTDTKVSYYNRMWEKFNYESALLRAATKINNDTRKAIEVGQIQRIFNGFRYNCL